MYELKNIIDFFEFSEKLLNVDISFHTTVCKGFIDENIGIINRFNTHCNKFCVYAKTDKEIFKKCLLQQEKVLSHCTGGAFCGMSYCGREEIIIPLKYQSTMLGFICIGGFCSNPSAATEKISDNLSSSGININKLIKYSSKLKKPQFDLKFIELMFCECADTLSRLMYEYHTSGAGKFTQNIYADIIAYINMNYTKPLKVCDIAKNCFCSQSYINHIFKKINNVSISAYINNLRMKKAQQLLYESDMSVKEISDAAGFSDPAYFSNTFKKYYNTSPTEYRKNTCQKK